MAPSTVTPFIQNQSHEEGSASCGLTPSLIHQRDKVTEHEPKTLKVNLSTMKFTTAKMKMNLQFTKKKSKRPSARTHTHTAKSLSFSLHTHFTIVFVCLLQNGQWIFAVAVCLFLHF